MGKNARIQPFLNHHRRAGFALAEIVVALFFVTLAVILVAGLSQQVISLGKSSKQTSAVVQLRSTVNSMTKNTNDWLKKMRSSIDTGALYSACIPDSSLSSIDIECPSAKSYDQLKIEDPELARVAGPQMHAVSAPIVNMMGEKIAGDEYSPLYLDSDGRPCESGEPVRNCALKSVGYFLRTNPDTSSSPGSVRFVVKVERNVASASSRGLGAMKPQYMSVDIGTEWRESVKGCAPGTLKLGYLSSGDAYCVSPTSSACSGQITIGASSAATSNCASLPSCGAGQSVIFGSGGTLECSDTSPCPSGSVFLGHYGGSGQKICTNVSMSCNEGEVQVGSVLNGDSLEAKCVAYTPNTCKANEYAKYDATTASFVCTTELADVGCAPGKVMTGLSNGIAICEDSYSPPNDGGGTDGVLSNNLNPMQCNGEQVMYGINAQGEAMCRNIASDTDTNTSELKSASSSTLPGWDGSAATVFSAQAKIWPMQCMSNGTSYSCGYHPYKFTIDPMAPLNAIARTNQEPKVTSRRCMYLNGTWRNLVYSEGYRYSRPCNGGIIYKEFNPAVAPNPSLMLTVMQNVSDDAPIAISTSDFPEPFRNAKDQEILPKASELRNYFEECTESDTDVHCSALNAALNKARVQMDIASSQGNAPQYCRMSSGYFNCGSGCGVVVYPKYVLNSAKRVKSYYFRYRWNRNYQSNEGVEGKRLPTGQLCNGANATAGAIRYAPDMPGSESGEAPLDE